MAANIKKALPFVLFLIVFACSTVITHHLSVNLLDNDVSGELVLAKCLYDEKSPVCRDWYYATEFKVNIQLVFAALFGIFSSWSDVRFFGTLIMQLLCILSLIFLLRSAGIKWEIVWLGCIFLILPYCVAYGRIVLYHHYYYPFLVFSFLITGCIFRSLDSSRKWVWNILLCLLSLYSCIYGIRQFFVTMAPLFGIALLHAVMRKQRIPLPFFLICIFGAAGLWINSEVISKNLSIETDFSHNIAFKGISDVYVVLFSIFRQFAYRSGIEKKSFLGLMSFAGIAVAVYALGCSLYGLFTEKDLKKQIMKGMLFTGIALTSGTLLFYEFPYNTRYDYTRYLIPASIWTVPLFCQILSETGKGTVRRILITGAAAVFTLNGLINLCFFYDPSYFSQDYDGLAFRSVEYITEFDDIFKKIKEENFDLGYTFSNQNVLIEKLNGLPVIVLEAEADGLTYSDWMTRKSFRDIRAGKVFLWADMNEALTFRAFPISDQAELLLNYKDKVLLFEIKDPAAFKSYLDHRYWHY